MEKALPYPVLINGSIFFSDSIFCFIANQISNCTTTIIFLVTTFLFSLSITLSAQDPITIFPGDYNNDGIVNHYDIIPLGIGMFLEGFPREEASSEWQPQFLFPPWPQQLPVSGINLGFVDGNGDGFISPDDLDVIQLNYDSTQSDAIPAPMPYNPAEACKTCAVAEIMVSFSEQTAFTNDTIEAVVSIAFPAGTLPENGTVALAFDLTYNPDWIVESSISIIPDTSQDDLMFIFATPNGVDSWKSSLSGKVEVGIAGKTGTNALYFSRPLFTFRTIVEDMIIRSADSVEVDFSLSIENLMILNISEQNVPHLLSESQIKLIDPIGFTSLSRLPVGKVYPQPATDVLYIEPEVPVQSIHLVNMDGVIVKHPKVNNGEDIVRIHTGGLAAGFYLLVAETSTARRVQKIAIHK